MFLITDWASAEIKHSGDEADFTNALDRIYKFEKPRRVCFQLHAHVIGTIDTTSTK